MEWLPFDGTILASVLLKVCIAMLLSLPVAWEREKATRSMGLRTFPLVAVASCCYVLIALSVVGPGSDAQARIIQGLMTGIGFIGGGAILKHGDSVRGTATAASIWVTGAVGASVGYALYEIATLLAVINVLALWVLTRVEERMSR
ncbi:MAG: MgtC/SapB family protein [Gammaproteobacteria bacterium]|nr:MgtC/SapB family protein [Gammaproteobacteria bacterium]